MNKEMGNKILGKVLEQGINIIILIAVAWFLWQRQVQLEDRFMKYMEDDREQMNTTINENTRAFEKNTIVLKRLETKLDAQ